MIIDISGLSLNPDKEIEINEEVNIDNEKLKPLNITSLNAKVSGKIISHIENDYYLNLNISGNIVLPCSLCLTQTDIGINVNVEGSYSEMIEEIGEINKKAGNSIDILPIIWENILMEIPIKITCPKDSDLKLSGKNWELVTSESEVAQKSAFDKLKDLL